MSNKNQVRGAYNKMMGKARNDRLREMKGAGEQKFGELKDTMHLPDTDMDQKSLLSLALGALLIVTGLYFVLSVKDDLC